MTAISTNITLSWEGTLSVAERDFQINLTINSPRPVSFESSVEKVDGLTNSYLVRLKLSADRHAQFSITDLSFSWLEPAVDMHGLYFGGNPKDELSRLPFWTLHKDVAAQRGLPFMSLIHRNGENRAAYGLLDQLTETSLHANLSEISRCYHMSIQKPANMDRSQQSIPVEGSWEEVLFVSYAHERWDSVLRAYAQLATTHVAQPLMPVPAHAYDPVFCTWTAIHHEVSHDWIMRQAPLAADLGFQTWLTDDGWFLDEGAFGNYEQVGAWQPSSTKFPDFKAHVAAVKKLGFRYLLWVSPFMVGTHSEQAKRYAHLLTDGQERERFHNLSPWHAETATIINKLLQRLVTDYDLDGLKIDFIDAIAIHSQRPDGASEQTLGASIFQILQESISALSAHKPDLLIEFRNAYTNLASRSYANLYRSSDIPFNAALNRWQAVMMRLLVPDRAVHMDPILWHPDDSDENVALHLISGIASVPMLSIELADYPPQHLAMVRHWIGFYNDHRDTIIHGDFRPQLHPTHIPLINFVGSDEVITGLYDVARVTRFDNTPRQWVLNASPSACVEFIQPSSESCQVLTRDKFGVVVQRKVYDALPLKLDVEIGGSLEIITPPPAT